MKLIYYCCVLLCNDVVIVYDMFLIFVLYLFTYVCAFAVVLLLLRVCVLHCLSERLSCIGGVGVGIKKGYCYSIGIRRFTATGSAYVSLVQQGRHTRTYCNGIGTQELTATGSAYVSLLQQGRHTRAYFNGIGIQELTATGSASVSLL